MNSLVLKNLAKPVNALVALGVAVLVFDVNYYMMATLPGTRDLMCVIGAGLTPLNIVFSIILSVLTGTAVVAVIEAYKLRRSKMLATSASGLGVFVGMMTVFCPLCTFPVLSIFGLSLLPLFNTFEIWFKVVSIGLMLLSLYILEGQLKDECKICK